jgi:hypothetical protein
MLGSVTARRYPKFYAEEINEEVADKKNQGGRGRYHCHFGSFPDTYPFDRDATSTRSVVKE